MRSVDDIAAELRSHPDVVAVVVWQKGDATGVGADPDRIEWNQVESDMTERGWDSIDTLKHDYLYDDDEKAAEANG